MKHHLQQLIGSAITALQQNSLLPAELQVVIQIENSRDTRHGDFACNIALTLAKAARRKPRELAEELVKALPASELVEKVEIAGPGFINFFMTAAAFQNVVRDIMTAGEAWGHSTIGNDKRVQVEFVSANPTGPLHVGHGRGAAYGAAVADLLAAAGFQVHREYYVNDAGRQMNILATSVWLRYLEQCGEQFTFPGNGYRGDYIYAIADQLKQKYGNKLCHSATKLFDNIPADESDGGDKEQHIDALIERSRELLGDDYEQVFQIALNHIVNDIREDLEQFGVVYEEWFSERSLTTSGTVDKVIDRLRESGHLYEKEGALWFRSSAFDDEKDRVVVRENGQPTYFASDIAYHADKMERGFERVIDIWGADHHGYVPRIRAALSALGYDSNRLDVLLVQFANLYRNGKRVQMSTRSGSFVTLRELREEVGNDAARFFYVMRKCEQHMDFDLELAKSQSNDNPVYYVQYAHARVCSVMRQLDEKQLSYDQSAGLNCLSLLTETHEQKLLRNLSRYPEILETAALNHEPHLLTHYLRELATDFHTYYNAHQFLVDSAGLRDARLSLILAVRQVIANGLGLLGVSAPESM